MDSRFNRLLRTVITKATSLILVLSLVFVPFSNPAEARQSELSGDFAEDTVTVATVLKETISQPKSSEAVQEDTLALINDYMSRYRPNQKVNGTNSFTTMQTALGSLAAHYKNSAKKPLPDKLKDRLDQELSRAEKSVINES